MLIFQPLFARGNLKETHTTPSWPLIQDVCPRFKVGFGIQYWLLGLDRGDVYPKGQGTHWLPSWNDLDSQQLSELHPRKLTCPMSPKKGLVQ